MHTSNTSLDSGASELCSSPCSGVHTWRRQLVLIVELVSGSALLVQVSTSGFVTMEKAAEIGQFFKDNPCPAADRIVKQNCEAIRLNC